MPGIKGPKVFLVEQPHKNLNLEAAEAYGELVFFFGQNDRRSSIFLLDDFCADLLRSFKEKNFRPECDYFCLTGKLIPTSVALATLIGAFKEVRILLYNSVEGNYASRVFSSLEILKEWKHEHKDSDVKID